MNPELDTLLKGIGKLVPVSNADYRQHVLNSQIIPTLKAWGFEHRHCVEKPDLHPKQAAAFRKMMARITGKGAIVALIGSRGLGKTTLAAQFALRTAWRNHAESLNPDGNKFRPHVIYRKTASFLSRYKPLYSDFGSINSESLIQSLDFLCRQQEFLVIDELHECDDRKTFLAMLTDIVDRRYAACRDTILICNQTPAEFTKSAGDSIISRLSEHGEIISCNWPSYRVQSDAV